MTESQESIPDKDPRFKLANTLRDFFLQALAQESTIREQAAAGRNIARGSLIKTDGPYLKIRLDAPSMDKDFGGDPYLEVQPQTEPTISPEDKLFLETVINFPTIWVLVPKVLNEVPEDTEGLTNFELAVIYSREITLHAEGPEQEMVIVSDTSLTSSAFMPDYPETWGDTDENVQKHKASLLNDVLIERYNLRTVGGPIGDMA